jgi:RNA-directed DNA polymerase
VTASFDAMSHSWTLRFLKHRIAEKRILRLVAKWLRVGVVEAGREIRSARGAPQGAVISPILANIYLHYVFDLWVHQWRRRKATGDVIVVRYADDTIVGFEHEHEAQAFLHDVQERMGMFDLALHPEKTRLIRFGRRGTWRREARSVRLPRVHALLHAVTQMGIVRYRAQDGQEADAANIGGDQGRAAQAHARSDRQDRRMGIADAQWASELLRGAG